MRILFVSPWFPYPPVNGSKIRIYQLLSALAEQHEVSLISFTRENEIVDMQHLGDICTDIQCIPFTEFSPNSLKARLGFFSFKPRSFVDTYNPQFERAILESIEKKKPQVVIFSQIVTACYLPKHANIPIVFEEVELGAIRPDVDGTNNPPRQLRKKMSWLKSKLFFQNIINRCSLCTVVSEKEKDFVEEINNRKIPVAIIPNGVEIVEKFVGGAVPVYGRLIYNGALTYRANYEAMDYFLSEIFPKVRSVIPEAHLFITGSTKNVDISRFSSNEFVHFTGFLDDLRPTLSSAWACVIPLLSGGGTRLKILEAMALEAPVVSTQKGAEGLNVETEKNILLANNSDKFAQQTIRILMDQDLRSRLSQAGRKLVEEEYDWALIRAQFVQQVERLIN